MKKLKLRFLRAAKSLGGFALARRFTSNGVRILCYHGIWLGRDSFPGDAMFMRAETFRNRLDTIRRLGYPVVPLDTAVAALEGKCQVPRNALAITIDDGWYSTYAEMLPALRERGMPATLYVDSEHLRTGLPVPHVMARYLHQVAGKPDHGPAALALAEAIPHARRLNPQAGHIGMVVGTRAESALWQPLSAWLGAPPMQ